MYVPDVVVTEPRIVPGPAWHLKHRYASGVPEVDLNLTVEYEPALGVAQLLAADYVAQRYKLRVWWAPDPNVLLDDSLGGQMQKLWRYFMYREPWSGLGSYDMIIYVRKDVAYLYWGNAR